MTKHSKRKVLALFLVFCMALSWIPGALAADTDTTASSFTPADLADAEYLEDLFEGSGDEDDPFLIATVDQLVLLQTIVNGQSENDDVDEDWGLGEGNGYGWYFRLSKDLDLSGIENWAPIGTTEYPFSASLDGGSHTISGLTSVVSVESGDAYAGLFGYVYTGAISNLTVKGTVSATSGTAGGNAYAGGVAAYAFGSEITNCAAESLTVTAEEKAVASRVGTASVSGATTQPEIPTAELSMAYAGGIVGQAETNTTMADVTITGCSAASTVTVKAIAAANTSSNEPYNGANAGGVAGQSVGVSVKNCSSGANVSLETSGTNTMGYYLPTQSYYLVSNYGYAAGGVVGALLGLGDSQLSSYSVSAGRNNYTYYYYECFTPASVPTVYSGGVSTATVSTSNARMSTNVGGAVGAVFFANVEGVSSSATVTGGRRTGGVIGYVTGGSTVSDCSTTADATVNDSAVTSVYSTSVTSGGGTAVGGVVGAARVIYTSYSSSGAASNPYYPAFVDCVNNTAVSTTQANYTGGIIGAAYYIDNVNTSGLVNNGEITANDSATSYAGGVAAYSFSGTIAGMVNTGAVSGGVAGGILGYGYINHTVKESENNGTVTGASYAGGIVGSGSMAPNVYSSVNNGAVNGGGYAGGIIGYAYSDCSAYTSVNNGPVTVTPGDDATVIYAGGILGSGSANGSVNNGTVSVLDNPDNTALTGVYLGGISGYIAYDGTVYNNANKGNVYAGIPTEGRDGLTAYYAGGIVGGTASTSSSTVYTNIYNNYSLGDVTGHALYVGGVTGLTYDYRIITNNYSAGALTTDSKDGLVGGVAAVSGKLNADEYVTDNYYRVGTAQQAVGLYDVGTAYTFDDTLALTLANGEGEPLADNLTDALDLWVTNTSDGVTLRWTLAEGDTYPSFIDETVSPAQTPGVYVFTDGTDEGEAFSADSGQVLELTAAGYLSAEADEATGETSYTDVNGVMSYQWYVTTTGYISGGTAIEGATSAAYRPDTTTSAGQFYYYVVGTNTTKFGDTASSPSQVITVTVSPAADDTRWYPGVVEAFSLQDPDEANSETNPYIIDTPAKLAYLAQQVNERGMDYAGAYFLQTANLDLNNQPFTPIGTVNESASAVSGYAFKGVYDGGEYEISNLHVFGVPNDAYNTTASSFALGGLFGYTNGATIKNVTLNGGAVTFLGDPSAYTAAKYIYLGGLVAYANETTIENCVNNGVTVGGVETIGSYSYFMAGGLVGMTSGGAVTGSSNSGSVTLPYVDGGSDSYIKTVAGGIVGARSTAANTDLTNCGNTGDITGGLVGGIVGGSRPASSTSAVYTTTGDVRDCVNRGNITGNFAGGIGNMTAAYSCANYGTVTGTGYPTYNNYTVFTNGAGGIIGLGTAYAYNCENHGAVSGWSAGGVIGGNVNSSPAWALNCLNTGTVTAAGNETYYSGSSYYSLPSAGGVVGFASSFNSAAVNCWIASSYSLGAVSCDALAQENAQTLGGQVSLGGLVGYAYIPSNDTSYRCVLQSSYYPANRSLPAVGGTGSYPTRITIENIGVLNEDGTLSAAEGCTVDTTDPLTLLNSFVVLNQNDYTLLPWSVQKDVNDGYPYYDGSITLIPAAAITAALTVSSEDGAADLGDEITFTVTADYGEGTEGQGTLTYQLYRSTLDVTDPASSYAQTVEGASGTLTDGTASFTITAANPGAWYYFAVVTNTADWNAVSAATNSVSLTTCKAADDQTWYGTAAEGFASGSGTAEDPYIISTAEELAYLAQTVNSGLSTSGQYYKLGADIDLTGWNWTSIGTVDAKATQTNGSVDESAVTFFQGNLDGDGHTVTLAQTLTGDYGGLFGAMVNATVKNLTVAGTIQGDEHLYTSTTHVYLGGLSAFAENCTISDVTTDVDMEITAKGSDMSASASGLVYVGGTVGVLRDSVLTDVVNNGDVTVNSTDPFFSNMDVSGVAALVFNSGKQEPVLTRCVNNGTITGAYGTGGVVAHLGGGTLDSCVNNGGIVTHSGAYVYAGGIVSDIRTLVNYDATLIHCVNTGAFQREAGTYSGSYGGGLVGRIYNGTALQCNITGCYNIGENSLSGLAGFVQNANATMSNCYNLGSATYGIAGQVSASSSYPFAVKNVFSITPKTKLFYTASSSYITYTDVGQFASVDSGLTAGNYGTLTSVGTVLGALYNWCLENEAGYYWVQGDEGYPVLSGTQPEGVIPMAAPSVTTEQEDLTLAGGETATLTADVKTEAYTTEAVEGTEETETVEAVTYGVGTVTYQWYVSVNSGSFTAVEGGSGTIEGGSGTVTLNVNNSTPGTYAYYLAVSNSNGFYAAAVQSDTITVTVTKATDDNAWYGGTASAFAGGDGTETNPYQISTPEELALFRSLVGGNAANEAGTAYNECFYLITADINMSNSSWTAPCTSISTAFAGVLDGGKHTVTLSVSGSVNAGLVAYNAGTIKNLTVTGSIVNTGTTSSSYAGAVAAYNYGGVIENCVNKADVQGGCVGGIAGYNTGTIENCTNNGQTYCTANYYVGGIVGYNKSGAVTDCVNNVKVNANGIYGQYEGGIAGYSSAGSYTDCVNYGAVIACSSSTYIIYLGGICSYASTTDTFTGCKNYGLISDRAEDGGSEVGYYAGGICGYRGTATGCVNYGEVHIKSCAGGILGTGTATINCLNAGAVSGSTVGGIAGNSTTVTGCVNLGSVSGATYVSGIVGSGVTATDCVNLGDVTGSATSGYTGGVMGYTKTSGAAITNSYSVGEISGDGYLGGVLGGNITNLATITNSYSLTGDVDFLGYSSLQKAKYYGGQTVEPQQLTAALLGASFADWALDGAQVTFNGASALVNGVAVTSCTVSGYPMPAWLTDEEADELTAEMARYISENQRGDISFTVKESHGQTVTGVTVGDETLIPDENGVYTLTLHAGEQIEVVILIQRMSAAEANSAIETIISSVAAGTQAADSDDSSYDYTLDYNEDGLNDLLDILDILYQQKNQETVDTPVDEPPVVTADGE